MFHDPLPGFPVVQVGEEEDHHAGCYQDQSGNPGIFFPVMHQLLFRIQQRDLFQEQGKFYQDKPETHQGHRCSQPGKEGTLVSQMIAGIVLFIRHGMILNGTEVHDQVECKPQSNTPILQHEFLFSE